ncbi:MAG TPA: GTP-binding protein [Candidatus Faecalibacterium faecipullorum]|uniref:GTP-binding protein n=1 Tax=Candidatus Faecalibacterium faecipullorum TaxID=2838578 RepID=A0A9D2MFJ3_9FIRM|nr:GTP-binding protein [Candidatus Faecalibacterium faecipullorum]
MIKIDLITGFLGAGKTTFIHAYARWLMARGEKIGILENDYGAVNVDRLLLQGLEGPQCDLEMVAGGCGADCHRRRFRTKLIAMGMLGYDRVIVEPSGIYDVDEFFDALCEEPVDRWYEPGSVIAVLDAGLEETLPDGAEYLLASEAAGAGYVVLSKVGQAGAEKAAAALAHLDRALAAVGCARRFGGGQDVLAKDWEELTDGDFARLAACGWKQASYRKRALEGGGFASLCFLDHGLTAGQLRRRAPALWQNKACGSVFRLKGFVKEGDSWLEVNATGDSFTLSPIPAGQEVLIVIGEGLDRQAVADALGAALPV